MKYYLIAGERSGDMHGANLLRGIKNNDPAAEFRGWGGSLMADQGMTLVTDYSETAFMGFVEVVKNLGTIRRLLKKCQADLLAYAPDVLILIDYPGFNLRMAAFAKQHGLRVFYYISPKVWAWNQRRALKIKASVDKLFTIFPFETAFFKHYHYDVDYVGNPIVDALAAFVPNPDFKTQNQLSERPIVALLPGSRQQELQSMLGVMLAVAPRFANYQFVVAGVSNLPASLYPEGSKVVFEAAYDLLHVATAAIVTSGTATLETALFGVPQVVCYKTSGITYQLAKWLIKVKYLSLVNLISDKPVVKELIQSQLTVENLTTELQKIIPTGSNRAQQLNDYAQLKLLVGEAGASERAGALTVKYLKQYLAR